MSRRRTAALLFVAFCTAAALLLARRARPAYPVSDIALTELYTRDAASLRLLVGPYSRFGWHHPGPMLFYLLAPGYILGGRGTAALHAAALALSLGAAAIAWHVASRRGGAALGGSVLVAIGLLVVRLPSLAVSPWNPHAVVIPAVALIVLAAVAATADTLVAPIVVGVASFLAQSDVAVVPFALVLGVCALRRASRRTWVVSATVGAAAWALPILEQLRDSPGNLLTLWRFFTTGDRAHVALSTALAAWGDATTAPLRFGFTLASGAIVEPSIAWPAVALACGLVAASAGIAVVAARRRLPTVAWFGALAALASLVALASLTRVNPPVSDHFAFWMAAIGAANVGTIAAWLPWTRRTESIAACCVAALIGGLALREVNRAADGVFAITTDAPSAPNFVTSIRAYLRDTRVARPLVRIDQEQWWLAAAVLDELDRQGIAFAVEDDWMPMFPNRFRADGSEDAELTLAGAGRRRDLAERPGNVTVDVSSFIHVEAIQRPRS